MKKNICSVFWSSFWLSGPGAGAFFLRGIIAHFCAISSGYSRNWIPPGEIRSFYNLGAGRNALIPSRRYKRGRCKIISLPLEHAVTLWLTTHLMWMLSQEVRPNTLTSLPSTSHIDLGTIVRNTILCGFYQGGSSKWNWVYVVVNPMIWVPYYDRWAL